MAPAAETLAGFRRHGGRLAAARAAFPGAPAPWLDLSTGVNPMAWDGARASLADLRRLPDPQALADLEAAAAKAFGVEPARVVAVAGAEAGLRLIPQIIAARSVAIVTPTYASHAQAWSLAGAQVMAVGGEAAARSEADVLVVVNPNNPDGAERDVARLADGRRWLVVDESFVDPTPEISVAGLALPRTLVLRSFGKFYGLPGLRLGFLVADAETAAAARARLGDWPVSAEALIMGRAAYADVDWARASAAWLARTARRLDELARLFDFELIGGTPLFRLYRHPDAADRFWRLAEHGVLTRPFDHDHSLLRLGLPGVDGWVRLAAALQAL